MGESLSVTVGAAELQLLDSRAVYWPAQKALLIADCHLGKAETFQHFGLSVPSGHTLKDLERLNEVQRKTGARQLYVLGDLVHARAGLTEGLVAKVAAWRETFPADITVVLGNHDRRAGGIPELWKMNVVAEGYEVDGLKLYHHPHDEGPCVYGHIHPTVMVKSVLDALSAAGVRPRVQAAFAARLRHLYGRLEHLPAAGTTFVRRAAGRRRKVARRYAWVTVTKLA